MNDRELMITRIQAQEDEIRRLNKELLNRAAPVVANLTDVLNATSQLAETGDKSGKHALRAFIQAIDRAREASGSIEIARVGGS